MRQLEGGGQGYAPANFLKEIPATPSPAPAPPPAPSMAAAALKAAAGAGTTAAATPAPAAAADESDDDDDGPPLPSWGGPPSQAAKPATDPFAAAPSGGGGGGGGGGGDDPWASDDDDDNPFADDKANPFASSPTSAPAPADAPPAYGMERPSVQAPGAPPPPAKPVGLGAAVPGSSLSGEELADPMAPARQGISVRRSGFLSKKGGVTTFDDDGNAEKVQSLPRPEHVNAHTHPAGARVEKCRRDDTGLQPAENGASAYGAFSYAYAYAYACASAYGASAACDVCAASDTCGSCDLCGSCEYQARNFGKGGRRNWQQRWFVLLDTGHLLYYKTQAEAVEEYRGSFHVAGPPALPCHVSITADGLQLHWPRPAGTVTLNLLPSNNDFALYAADAGTGAADPILKCTACQAAA